MVEGLLDSSKITSKGQITLPKTVRASLGVKEGDSIQFPVDGITCSMSRAGNVWDNSAMESFFSSLKTERAARKVYRTRDEARADVFDYIERFYNPRGRHSKLGYLSPMEFKARAMLA
ncbi:MAG: type II toxin-antitoxin system PrlF family antitoxin [Tabrizicola sp.]|nr:type II toxin-antitoxin system PrlF family antitoxin [Tabrizicola sp.]MDP3261885.1 type II toxin-antitoxin system PrlF family antitoxin [Tabrizicola sp.]MDP3650017.1 type II toxin-antitoxin system PrlF family antitoxin [Paracoccaceae bacterium]